MKPYKDLIGNDIAYLYVVLYKEHICISVD